MRSNSTFILISILLLCGCWSPHPDGETKKLPGLEYWQDWYASSTDFYRNNPQSISVSIFAEKLDSYLVTRSVDHSHDRLQSVSATDKALPTVLSIQQSVPNTSTHEAKLERQMQLIKMLLAHHQTFYGALFLNAQDSAITESSPEWRVYTHSLIELASRYPVITSGTLDIYEADDQLGLLAYQRKDDEARAYIVFNFSFDQQILPLPLGFMASTKVTFWQSDNTKIRTFVTDQPLRIQPLTTAIVIVN